MGFFSGASSFVHRNTATLRQTPNITPRNIIPTMNDIKKDVGNIATGNVGGIIDRNTDSVPSWLADPIRAETNRITAAHHTNLKYMREAAMGLLGYGGGGDGGGTTTTTAPPSDNEGGSRGTAAGRGGDASGKSSRATRVIREKNKPVPSMITQQKKLGGR